MTKFTRIQAKPDFQWHLYQNMTICEVYFCWGRENNGNISKENKNTIFELYYAPLAYNNGDTLYQGCLHAAP